MSKASKAKADISQEYIDNIKNYGDSIETIETFVEAVRKLPGMYIGAIGNMGWLSCLREIIQNAIDEMEKKASPCHYVKITFDERNQSVLVEDTGRGIPHGSIIHIYTSAHSSSNYTKKPGEYSSGVHGVGSGVALSLSKTFNVKSYILGKAVEVDFTAGIPWKYGEKPIECPEGRQGTTIHMTPDYDVLGPVTLTCHDVFDMVFKIFPLINIGDRIDFTGIDINGKTVIYEELVNTDGIITDLMLRTQTPLVAPIVFKNDNGTMKAEIAFTYDSADITSAEDINSFSNYTNTISGTHVTGFVNALCDFFRNYMNKIFLGEKSKIKVIANDVKSGLKAIVVCAHLHPIFIGQSKAMITNEDLKDFVYELTRQSLDQWAKNNPSDLQKVCKYLKEVAEVRMKSDEGKINLSKKYSTDLLTGKPKKYVQSSGNKNQELIIVEGDSALGSAKNSRDSTRQSLFPEVYGALVSNG